jgi:hypothetical protein
MDRKIPIADPNKSADTALGEHLKRAGFAPVVVHAGECVLPFAESDHIDCPNPRFK